MPSNASTDVDTGFSRLATPSNVGLEPLSRIWPSGLTSCSLGLTGEDVIDLNAHYNESARPTLRTMYEIDELAEGAGSFGIACSAHHRESGRPCVVKMVNKTEAGDNYRAHLVDGGLFARFLQMTQDMPHPNVVHYLDLLEGPEYYYVVMERLEGAELFEYVVASPGVSELRCRDLMSQILACLRHLHQDVKIFHRDVKLDNFRFRGKSEESDLVLLDFGFARFCDGPLGTNIAGTLMYLAPEVAKLVVQPDACDADAAYSAPVDLWAAGVILYVLLVGRAPFKDDDIWSFGQAGDEGQQRLDKVLSASELTKASHESLDLLMRLLVIDKTKRITAAAALDHSWFALEDEVLSSRSVARDEEDALRHVRMHSQKSQRLSNTVRTSSGCAAEQRAVFGSISQKLDSFASSLSGDNIILSGD